MLDRRPVAAYMAFETQPPMRFSTLATASVLPLAIPVALLTHDLPTRAEATVGLTNISAGPSGGLRLDAVGPADLVYSLQLSPNLRDWRTLDFKQADSAATPFQDDAAAGEHARFYRVRAEPPATSAQWIDYRGWSNSIVLSNGVVEATVVPAIGRIMQFRFLDEADGPFWENPALFGRKPAANSWDTPGSFGGAQTRCC